MVRKTGLSPSSVSERSPYEIQIQGELDGSWNEWFNAIEMTIEHSSDRLPLTTLHCPAMDQAKLRGILNKIWDMNLNLISVRRVTNPTREERSPQGSEGFE